LTGLETVCFYFSTGILIYFLILGNNQILGAIAGKYLSSFTPQRLFTSVFYYNYVWNCTGCGVLYYLYIPLLIGIFQGIAIKGYETEQNAS